jgi:hypothetical protein
LNLNTSRYHAFDRRWEAGPEFGKTLSDTSNKDDVVKFNLERISDKNSFRLHDWFTSEEDLPQLAGDVGVVESERLNLSFTTLNHSRWNLWIEQEM